MANPNEWSQFYNNNNNNQTIFTNTTTTPTTVTTTTTTTSSAATESRRLSPETGRVTKPTTRSRRSRASRRTPTTLLNTDTSNFRAMVQQFTGGPSALAFGSGHISSGFTLSTSSSDPLPGSSHVITPQQQQQQQNLWGYNFDQPHAPSQRPYMFNPNVGYSNGVFETVDGGGGGGAGPSSTTTNSNISSTRLQ
ncbi:unnamed protein product [Cochlearia groenlandica]